MTPLRSKIEARRKDEFRWKMIGLGCAISFAAIVLLIASVLLPWISTTIF
jgi:hypothetical protein